MTAAACGQTANWRAVLSAAGADHLRLELWAL